MRLLITGGCGFIGTNLIRHVLAADPDVEVTNLDALTYAGDTGSLDDLADHPRYRLVVGDIVDAALVDEHMREADAVIHLAAESHVDRSIDDPGAFLRTNVTGTGVVLDAARRHGVERFLHASTDEVYGSLPAPTRASEDDPLRPTSPYSASKAGADLLAQSYRTTYDYPVMVTRTTNNVGPWQYPEKLVPLAVTRLLAGETVGMYGDGSQVRDWLHVADSAAAQWLVLTRGQPGTTYNVGAGNETPNRQVLELLCELCEAPTERIVSVADRPGHDQRYAVDASRIRALGWAPAHDLRAALTDAVDWLRANEDWWRPLVAAGASRRRGLGR